MFITMYFKNIIQIISMGYTSQYTRFEMVYKHYRHYFVFIIIA